MTSRRRGKRSAALRRRRAREIASSQDGACSQRGVWERADVVAVARVRGVLPLCEVAIDTLLPRRIGTKELLAMANQLHKFQAGLQSSDWRTGQRF